jgi:exosortase/archaeosortase family protein
MIGITSPGGYYSGFADRYLDYVAGLRWLLLHVSAWVLEISSYNVYVKDAFTIKLENGRGVNVVYSCIGYGVMSFWTAFVLTNKTGLKKSITWVLAGLLLIFGINVARISIMLVAVNEAWASPFGFDNHTWFNFFAYVAIFILIYFFDRSHKIKIERHPAADKEG